MNITIESFEVESKESGRILGFTNCLNKFQDRSILEAKKEIDYSDIVRSGYGDIDLVAKFMYKSISCWTDSPEIDLHVNLPIHISCNGNLFRGWCARNHQRNHSEELNLDDFSGTLKADDSKVDFVLSDLEEEQLEQIYEIFFSARKQILKDEFLKNILK